jgi:hypothetical protein
VRSDRIALRALLILLTSASFLLRPLLAAAASRPPAEQEKIDWLLAQVRSSDAVFVRNGSEYDGAKAAAHLKSKLFFAGSRVQTARDFVLGLASRSEQSGKPYEMRPKDSPPRPLGEWLLERLVDHEHKLEQALEHAREKSAGVTPRH